VVAGRGAELRRSRGSQVEEQAEESLASERPVAEGSVEGVVHPGILPCARPSAGPTAPGSGPVHESPADSDLPWAASSAFRSWSCAPCKAIVMTTATTAPA